MQHIPWKNWPFLVVVLKRKPCFYTLKCVYIIKCGGGKKALVIVKKAIRNAIHQSGMKVLGVEKRFLHWGSNPLLAPKTLACKFIWWHGQQQYNITSNECLQRICIYTKSLCVSFLHWKHWMYIYISLTVGLKAIQDGHHNESTLAIHKWP